VVREKNSEIVDLKINSARFVASPNPSKLKSLELTKKRENAYKSDSINNKTTNVTLYYLNDTSKNKVPSTKANATPYFSLTHKTTKRPASKLSSGQSSRSQSNNSTKQKSSSAQRAPTFKPATAKPKPAEPGATTKSLYDRIKTF